MISDACGGPSRLHWPHPPACLLKPLEAKVGEPGLTGSKFARANVQAPDGDEGREGVASTGQTHQGCDRNQEQRGGAKRAAKEKGPRRLPADRVKL